MIDYQSWCIIIIFALLFLFEMFESRENFSTNGNTLLDFTYDPSQTSVNLSRRNFGNFGNFGAFGSFPNMLCASCKLTGDSVTPPYMHSNELGDENGSLYGKVARSCNSTYGKNYNDLNKPLLVSGRSNRTRQCRRLI